MFKSPERASDVYAPLPATAQGASSALNAHWGLRMKNVDVIEKRTGLVVATIPIQMAGMNYVPTVQEYEGPGSGR